MPDEEQRARSIAAVESWSDARLQGDDLHVAVAQFVAQESSREHERAEALAKELVALRAQMATTLVFAPPDATHKCVGKCGTFWDCRYNADQKDCPNCGGQLIPAAQASSAATARVKELEARAGSICRTVRDDKPGSPICGAVAVAGFCAECLDEHAEMLDKNASPESLAKELAEAKAQTGRVFRDAAAWAGATPCPPWNSEDERSHYDTMADLCAAEIAERARAMGLPIKGFTWTAAHRKAAASDWEDTIVERDAATARVAELEAQADRDAREIDALDTNGERAERRVAELEKQLADAHEHSNSQLRRAVNAEKHLAAGEASLDAELATRDRYHETADDLTAAIAKHFAADFGEHSSGNDPWRRALDALNGDSRCNAEKQLATHSARGCTCADRIQDLEKQLADERLRFGTETDAALDRALAAEAELARLRALPEGLREALTRIRERARTEVGDRGYEYIEDDADTALALLAAPVNSTEG